MLRRNGALLPLALRPPCRRKIDVVLISATNQSGFVAVMAVGWTRGCHSCHFDDWPSAERTSTQAQSRAHGTSPSIGPRHCAIDVRWRAGRQRLSFNRVFRPSSHLVYLLLTSSLSFLSSSAQPGGTGSSPAILSHLTHSPSIRTRRTIKRLAPPPPSPQPGDARSTLDPPAIASQSEAAPPSSHLHVRDTQTSEP